MIWTPVLAAKGHAAGRARNGRLGRGRIRACDGRGGPHGQQQERDVVATEVHRQFQRRQPQHVVAVQVGTAVDRVARRGDVAAGDVEVAGHVVAGARRHESQSYVAAGDGLQRQVDHAVAPDDDQAVDAGLDEPVLLGCILALYREQQRPDRVLGVVETLLAGDAPRRRRASPRSR